MDGTKNGKEGLVRLAGDTAPVAVDGVMPLIGKREIAPNARRYAILITNTTKNKEVF